MVKNPPDNAGEVDSIPGLERSGEGNDNPLQYLCLVGYNSWGHRRAGHNLVTKNRNKVNSYKVRKNVKTDVVVQGRHLTRSDSNVEPRGWSGTRAHILTTSVCIASWLFTHYMQSSYNYVPINCYWASLKC